MGREARHGFLPERANRSPDRATQAFPSPIWEGRVGPKEFPINGSLGGNA